VNETSASKRAGGSDYGQQWHRGFIYSCARQEEYNANASDLRSNAAQQDASDLSESASIEKII
jgi:hypothetical protein